MPDGGDDEFERRLRDALHREGDALPLRIDAAGVRDRVSGGRRMPSWVLPIALPIGAAVVAASVILNAFPGEAELAPGTGSSTGAASTTPTPGETPATSAVPAATPSPHPAERADAAAASRDGVLVLVGGRRSTELSSVAMFDGRVWSELPALPEPRLSAAAALLADGTVLVAGGRHAGESLDSALRLPPGADAWEPVAAMPYAQAHMGVAVLEGRVHFFGGSEAEHAADVLVHDPGTGAWSAGVPMPVAASRVAATAIDGVAYLFGGRSEPDGEATSTVLRYDATSGAWSALADLPGIGSSMSAIPVGGQVWLIGATSAEPPRLARLLVYDPASDGWTERPVDQVPFDRWYAAVLQRNGTILVVGGYPFLVVDTIDTTEPPTP